jgi:hypothetical protein
MQAQFGIAAPRSWARVAGVCWLLTIAAGLFAERSVRAKLVVDGDAAATIHNIFANEAIYRLGTAAEFVGTATYLVLTGILYLLLAPVSRPIALIAAIFGVAGCTIWFLNVVNNMAPLVLLGGPPSGAEFASMQSAAFAFVRMGNETLLAGMLCFGVHCLLLGGLFARSNFFPWPIGVALAAGGLGYLASGLAHIAMPALGSLIGGYGFLAGGVGELLTGLWLAFVGLNAAKWAARA